VQYYASHPIGSVILRIVLVLFFVIVVAGVIIGFLGSSDFHANVQTTLSTVNDKINGINSTIYDTYNQLTTSLVSVNATIPTGSLQTLEKRVQILRKTPPRSIPMLKNMTA